LGLFADATNKTLGALLSKAVTPLIEPLLKVYAKPVSKEYISEDANYLIFKKNYQQLI